MDELTSIFKALDRTASLLASTAQKVDIIENKIEVHDLRIENTEREIREIKRSERIDRQQAKQIKAHVMARTAGILGIQYDGKRVADESIEDDKKYRGGFISRLYCEAKMSGLMGDPYSETKKKDYEDVITFIDAWYPNVDGGTDGYKKYLDNRRDEKILRESIKKNSR